MGYLAQYHFIIPNYNIKEINIFICSNVSYYSEAQGSINNNLCSVTFDECPIASKYPLLFGINAFLHFDHSKAP